MTTRRPYHARPRPAPRPRATDSTPRDRARLIVALDGRHWVVSDDREAEAELLALAERLAEVLAASVSERTDTERLDWLEVALRDGLAAEARDEQVVIGYCDAAGVVDVSDAAGTGHSLRAAIDDAIGREDAGGAAHVAHVRGAA